MDPSTEKGLSPSPHLLPPAHQSTLRGPLYLLSFAPPLPSIYHFTDFCLHPYTLYAFGAVNAVIAGLGLPAFDIILGFWTNGIIGTTNEQIVARGNYAGWLMTIVGVITIITFGLFMVCFSLAGIQLSSALREKYFAAILVQDATFFDHVGAGEIATRVSKDIETIREGLGPRVGFIIWSLSTGLAALISSFIQSAKLAGVLFSLIPFTMLTFGILGFWADSVAKSTAPIEGRSASLSEQIISSIRVVQSFDMGQRLVKRLDEGMLKPLRRLGRKKSATRALESGAMFGAMFLTYSVSFWYGSIQVAEGLQVGTVLTAFYNFVNLFFALATIVPHLTTARSASQALSNLRLQIERQPLIDVRNPSGLQLHNSEGEKQEWVPSFALEGVTFAYPSKPEIPVLKDVTLDIQPGKFTAFVGPSGSGKSTLAALLLRLYDPATATVIREEDAKIMETLEEKKDMDMEKRVQGSGIVKFAGHDIRDLNVQWLRSQVSVVLQNPQLLSGTILDNVAAGLAGSALEYRPGTEDGGASLLKDIRGRCEEALRKAQAEFVFDLPDGMDTVISGGRTGVLSGGQTQRIALARALVRRPQCLLLDEATSAVSTDTELKIQEMLEEEQKRGMTLIVVAHRLSTIAGADKIIVMVAGKVTQEGTYEELLDPKCESSVFRSLVNANQEVLEKVSAVGPASPLSQTTANTSRVTLSNAAQPSQRVDSSYSDLPPIINRATDAIRSTRTFLIIGVLAGLGVGGCFVFAAWLQGGGVNALRNPDFPQMRREANRWALWFLLVAIGTTVVAFLNAYCLECSGEEVVRTLKRESIRALLRQEVAFFEGEDGGSGGLTAETSIHPGNVGNVIGLILAAVSYSLSMLVAIFIMAFILDWRLGVIVIPALALTMICGKLSFDLNGKFEDSVNSNSKEESDYVSECANSAQLNASLGREVEAFRRFRQTVRKRTSGRRYLLLGSMFISIAQGVVHLFGALILWWGATLLARNQTNFHSLFSVIEAVIIAIYTSTKLLTYSGDFTRMGKSLGVIQSWLDRKPLTNRPSDRPFNVSKSSGISFSNVDLRYPSRPNVVALDAVDCEMELGKSYAFCGTSGAGKSSILTLLQRFYEPTSGAIFIDGINIQDMEMSDLRSRMGYVSQEAVLFEGTLRWNVALGAADPDTVTDEEIMWACEQACMSEFIKASPEGLLTELGMKGGRLSGGQRQRLCIARALIRNPQILLLDEATSALDNRSEAQVQQALENASRGRTTIMIAHRLSTIRNADVINVMEQGTIVETGSHRELLARRGRYFALVQAQL